MPLRVLALALLLPALSDAQTVSTATVTSGGLRWHVTPQATVRSVQARETVRNRLGVYIQVELVDFQATRDAAFGIVVDGVRYDELSFDGAIAQDLLTLHVSALDLQYRYDGVNSCRGRVRNGFWRPREIVRELCGGSSRARLAGFELRGVTVEGLPELQAKVRRLRDAAVSPPASR